MAAYRFKTKRGKHLIYYLNENWNKEQSHVVDVETDGFFYRKVSNYPMTKELADHISKQHGITVCR